MGLSAVGKRNLPNRRWMHPSTRAFPSDPSGTSLEETDRLLRQVESVLQKTPEVQTYSRRTGLQLGGGITEANTGDFFVRLKPFPRRGIEEVMDDVRARIEKHVPTLQRPNRVRCRNHAMDCKRARDSAWKFSIIRSAGSRCLRMIKWT